jgi:uncharacterized protein
VTSTQILEHLAHEFSLRPEHVRSTLEMLDAGLCAPFIGRVRRAETGGMSESLVRRVAHLRDELEELDRRRGTILRMLENQPTVTPNDLERVRTCMDRFELEDLFVPHRRPEPEVQLALDRGLGRLADLLVEPVPHLHPRGAAEASESAEGEAGGDSDAQHESEPASETHAPANPIELSASHDEHETPTAAADTAEATAAEANAVAHEESSAHEEPLAHEEHADAPSDDAAPAPASTATATETWEGAPAALDGEGASAPAVEPVPAADPAALHEHVELTPALARLCAPFVNPDKGVHTESEALAGAMRILSDRLGRDARLRSTVRRLLRKHGVLSARATVNESRLGRHRSLLKLRQPLRQIQGHRLLAIRQAQKERVLTTVITLDRNQILPKVRAALGRHTHPDHAGVLDLLARQALDRRLLPVVEADVRLELKERADEEALRFLSQHLRQVLLTPPWGPRLVIGVDVNAKGDWTLVPLDEAGVPHVQRTTAEDGTTTEMRGARIEVGEKDAAALGAELDQALTQLGAHAAQSFAVGHSKTARVGVAKLRAAIASAKLEQFAFIVNDSGLGAYANSEIARQELAEYSVPQRMAISLGRRLQDPLGEILKIDPRHLGLGAEQSLVSKANLKRTYTEAIESATALVGCDVNRASAIFLEHLPGLDRDAARRVVERRAQKPFESREELRSDGLLTEAQWTSAVAWLRVLGSREPLDATSLHPQQYDLARRVVESTGGNVEDSLRRPGATKGLRRIDFDVDEATWRDLMREIGHPGRDARLRLFVPRLLDPATELATLTAGRTIEGTITNVASFGAFVDLGLGQDGMLHISEISERYVRDARELLSIGQTVRVRIVDASSPRLALSLKNVAELEPVRRERPAHHGAESEGRGERTFDRRGRGGRGRRGQEPRDEREPKAPVRAAQTRRDGLVPGTGGRRGDRPGGGGGPRGRGRERGGDRDESFRPEDLKAASGPARYNPFASFFKGSAPAKEEAGEESPTS